MNFTLWANKYKKTDKHPDYILNKWDGENNFKVGAGWVKGSKDGSKYISISYDDEFKKEEKDKPIEPMPF